MFNNYLNMFGLLSNVAKLQDTYNCDTYNWQNVFHESIKKICAHTYDQAKEIESICFTMLDSFEKYASHNVIRKEKEEAISIIMNKDQVEQRSEQWFEDMKTMLTASEFSNLFESERMKGTFILSKLNPEKRNQPKAVITEFLIATGWGIRFEPVVRMYLEGLWKCKIYESGRLKHDTNSQLGASPDGIIVESEDHRYGRLVEIKCPYSRKIGEGIPFKYWVQMQIQMEVTNLMECEYIEVEIKSKTPKQLNPELTPGIYSGELYLMEKHGLYIYVYDILEKQKYLVEEYNLIETIPYSINDVYNVCVKRDKKWYESTKELQENFWKDMEKAKDGMYILAEPKYKRMKKDVCLIEDTI